MNLDSYTSFMEIDTQNMLAEIDNLPQQLQDAWDSSTQLSLPNWSGIQRVLIAGMGGSAIGADLLAAYTEPFCQVPLLISRDYDLPAWAQGETTLVIASSHSGNTEETLSAFKQAQARNCRILVVSTGGKLVEAAQKTGVPTWRFEHHGQPRAAVGFSFGLLLGAFTRLGLIPDPTAEIGKAIRAMLSQQARLKADVPVHHNPAKRMAGQLMGRLVVVMGAGFLAPVARRWKGQISEVAKSWSQFEVLPEADHNTLAGILNPETALSRLLVFFLRAGSLHERNQQRTELTRKIFMLEGITTDYIDAVGDTPLEQLWTLLHFGDYIAYYLAMAYGVDPTPVEAIENFKLELATLGTGSNKP
ncbi:MAG TPA: bifunctional phosphoglucose/phosphomannose isomerase [Anaerolineales bacterium]|nr:bifunctional phosphoglucose/phosphomannose isomerase [Anaerolineales bacterium]